MAFFCLFFEGGLVGLRKGCFSSGEDRQLVSRHLSLTGFLLTQPASDSLPMLLSLVGWGVVCFFLSFFSGVDGFVTSMFFSLLTVKGTKDLKYHNYDKNTS